MRFDHNQIMTAQKIVRAGQVYQYTEDSQLAVVMPLYCRQTEDMIEFELKVLRAPEFSGFHSMVGKTFKVSAALGHYAYGGMWRIWNRTEYSFN